MIEDFTIYWTQQQNMEWGSAFLFYLTTQNTFKPIQNVYNVSLCYIRECGHILTQQYPQLSTLLESRW